MNQKLLFISYFLPPFNSPQSIQIGRLLKYLSKNNKFEIYVLTANLLNHNKDEELYPNIFDNIKEVTKIDDKVKNKYIKFGLNKLIPSLYQLPDEYKAWHEKAYEKIVSKYDKNFFDTILTFSFPLSSNILGKKLKNFFNAKWIAHNSDPWSGNHFNGYEDIINEKNLELEKECFVCADKLIFTSSETVEFYKSRYPQFSDKIYVLNHSYDKELYPKDITSIKKDKIILRYIGGFYGQRTPEPIYKVIDKLVQDKKDLNFTFEIYGFGRSIKNLMKKYDVLDYVHFKGSVSYIKSLELMKTADYLILIDAPSDNKSIFFPSKLVDYMGANKPIIVISPDGTSKRVALENVMNYFSLNETEKLMNMLSQLSCSHDISYNNKYSIDINIIEFERIIDEY